MFRSVIEELVSKCRFMSVSLYRMCDCVYVMFLFVLFMGAVGAEEDTVLCEMLGSPESPLLSKGGDITIGGAFSIHSQISKTPLSFTDNPERLLCSRYCLLSRLLVSKQTKSLLTCENCSYSFQDKSQRISLCPNNDFCH